MKNTGYKNILLKFHELLLGNVDPNEVLPQLLTAGVLTSDDKEKIEEKPSQKGKNEELLMMLATKGPRAYEEFVKALEKTQCSLACQLLKEGMHTAGQHEMVSVLFSKYFVDYPYTSLGGLFTPPQESPRLLNHGNQLTSRVSHPNVIIYVPIMTSHMKRTTFLA